MLIMQNICMSDERLFTYAIPLNNKFHFSKHHVLFKKLKIFFRISLHL